jgi:hypothetical protein
MSAVVLCHTQQDSSVQRMTAISRSCGNAFEPAGAWRGGLGGGRGGGGRIAGPQRSERGDGRASPAARASPGRSVNVPGASEWTAPSRSPDAEVRAGEGWVFATVGRRRGHVPLDRRSVGTAASRNAGRAGPRRPRAGAVRPVPKGFKPTLAAVSRCRGGFAGGHRVPFS